jgi:hypothetical protein
MIQHFSASKTVIIWDPNFLKSKTQILKIKTYESYFFSSSDSTKPENCMLEIIKVEDKHRRREDENLRDL